MLEMNDGWGWWMLFGSMFMVVFWGLIIWAVVTLNRPAGRDGGRGGRSSAIEILEERFARGEISREQLDEGRRTLVR